eukprot:scaffold290184_cov33-Tisochrysis_lutea.AAC.2
MEVTNNSTNYVHTFFAMERQLVPSPPGLNPRIHAHAMAILAVRPGVPPQSHAIPLAWHCRIHSS